MTTSWSAWYSFPTALVVTEVITAPAAPTISTVAPCPVDVTIGTLGTVSVLAVVGVVTKFRAVPVIKLPLDRAPAGIVNASFNVYPDPDEVNVKEV